MQEFSYVQLFFSFQLDAFDGYQSVAGKYMQVIPVIGDKRSGNSVTETHLLAWQRKFLLSEYRPLLSKAHSMRRDED